MKFKINFFFFIYFFCAIDKPIFAQEQRLSVEFGETNISLNKPFVVSILLKNEEERPTSIFPEIKGFKKRSNISSSNTSNIGGKAIVNQKVTQEYFADKLGTINVPSFSIQVNGETITTTPIIVVVNKDSEKDEIENFKDFIDGSAYEFVDVKDDAFFAITTNKAKPYVGEGFIITIAFYIATTNKADMEFSNVNGQLDNIIKKIRPKNCWEENTGISEIKCNRLIKIGNKNYNQCKIYQAIYYPFNNQTITIPAVAWQMLKYKIAKDQELSKEKVQDSKQYYSKAIQIKPRNLPKNNNFSADFVGDYFLEEGIDKKIVQTGKSFNYQFKVLGYGNMAILDFPETLSDTLFEIYEPKESRAIVNSFGKLIEEKTFSFDIVPKFAGKYSLKNHFRLQFFNPRTQTFEELRAAKEIEVVGNAINEELEPVVIENDVYENIEKLNSSEDKFDFRNLIFNLSNLIILAMVFGMIYIIWPTKNK